MHIEENISLAEYTTLKVGGRARWFTEVTSQKELVEAIDWAKEHTAEILILGGGSNTLVDDEGWSGLVIRIAIRGCQYRECDDGVVLCVAGAGEVFDDVVHETIQHEWWGLENLSAIPGSVGATPIQNVGAYGVEVGDRIETVTVLDMNTRTLINLATTECMFGYRHSIFKEEAGKHWVVLSVTFRLSKKPAPVLTYADLVKWQETHGPLTTVRDIREAVIAIRREKFPDWHVVGTAGSFFKNPIVPLTVAARLREVYPTIPCYESGDGMVKLSLGYILDKICGLRGYTEGSVRLYEKQALVLVQEGATTATEVIEFAKKISSVVKQKTNIAIVPEVSMTKNFFTE